LLVGIAQLKKKAQGADGPFSWDRVAKEHRDEFDFIIGKDEGGAGSNVSSKILVFMLVKKEWLPDDDPADKVVGDWTSDKKLHAQSSTPDDPKAFMLRDSLNTAL
jgi:hypothetical protein